MEAANLSDVPKKMEAAKQTHLPPPLVSRLDHLDFIIKNLEGKHNMPKWGSSSSIRSAVRPSVPLDVAIREAYFKGTLMDRVASLEQRVFQLYFDMESNNASGSSSQTCGHAFSTQGSKPDPSSSLSTINMPNQGSKQESLVLVNKLSKIEEKPEKERGKKDQKAIKQKAGKNRPTTKNGKTSKSAKKKAPPKWPRMKILGC